MERLSAESAIIVAGTRTVTKTVGSGAFTTPAGTPLHPERGPEGTDKGLEQPQRK